jgi:hypothetical protein
MENRGVLIASQLRYQTGNNTFQPNRRSSTQLRFEFSELNDSNTLGMEPFKHSCPLCLGIRPQDSGGLDLN